MCFRRSGSPRRAPGLCKIFEEWLKSQYTHQRNITYDVADLFAFVDALGDLGALVLEPEAAVYTPHNKEWVKQRVLKHLQALAGTSSSSSK